ncbi:putative mitochondrial protein, partial [Tanacetum coccineum]
ESEGQEEYESEQLIETNEEVDNGQNYSCDAMLLPLGGCEMVLGVRWLSTLVVKRWRRIKMFIEVSRLFYKTFEDVFAVSTKLPPQRSLDHKIPLVPNTPPINIRPYKHPPSQKDEIEVMVKELLDSRVIRASRSSFSSPIAMVKKKDETWRMCVDYRQLNKKFALVFFDDILVYSKTVEDHCVHLQQVLQVMRDNKLFAKQSKCSFAVMKVEYLGHVIAGEGLATDPSKIEAIQNWPIPSTLKQLKGFLGLIGYYRRFIKSYAMVSQPLNALLKKNYFQWSSTVEVAFMKLKQAMTEDHVLGLPNFDQMFIIETDALSTGIRAVLVQNGHPLAYMSKILSTKYYEKEFMAVVAGLGKWKGYLFDGHFKIRTDHFSLKYLLDQKLTTPFQLKWIPKLLGYDYEIVYKRGVDNVVADALSRVN